ncbi:4a-hydroxytetrahydrobiopterin dehydratase [Paramicrobacterium chengjingii]|uniref:Putative pterin-4-alpha-carbinolamine dehydratase n=2 Tax=Paramicrobacterium chengjingii TaxID=2769067 RepID=A0ABX6YGN8_9MICO|nr:4a-hydroxytetrahydrobiopterin dehydratase [Microbacterium chengjingii]QPZ37932.1 4a-hydroxytetrahydrobiopterin dehydratase [Microbacterium chengjingii]
MVNRMSAEEFAEASGVADWEADETSAVATFATGTFSDGVSFVDEIGALADAAEHHPDVELTYPAVTVTLTTHEVDGLSERDVELARQISQVAHDSGIHAS